MIAPVQTQVKAHLSDGVKLEEAQNLLIYVDDQSYIAEALGTLVVNFINSSARDLPPLTQLSYQFLNSSELGGLEQTVRAIQGLIHQAPKGCKIGIICDQDQKEFTGNQLAREIKERCSSHELAGNIKLAAYTANAYMEYVAKKWEGLGASFPKMEIGVDPSTTITAMFKYLLHEN